MASATKTDGPDVLDLINLVYNRVASTGAATYSRALGLGIMDFRVLDVLAAEPSIAARRIVEVIGIDKGSVSRALKNLDDRGLLIAASPEDRRRLIYTLSPQGEAVHAKARLLARERERLTIEGVSEADQARLVSTLQAMLRNTEGLKTLASEQPKRRPSRAG